MNFHGQRRASVAGSAKNAPARLSGPINGVPAAPQTHGFGFSTVAALRCAPSAPAGACQPWQPPRTSCRPRVFRHRVPFTPGRSYHDTVVIHFVTLPGTFQELKWRILGSTTSPRLAFHEVRGNQGYLVSLHQPSRKELRRFGKLQRECSSAPYFATLSRFDVAADFKPKPDEDLQSVRAWLERCLTIRNRKTQPTLDWHDTYYTGEMSSAVLGVVYSDALSKLDGEPCVHMDLRIQGAKAVGRAGYKYADELEDLDPSALFEKHVLLVDHNVEHLVGGLASLRRRAQVFSPSSIRDADSDALNEVERYKLYRAQTLKDFYPKAFKALDQIPTAILGLPRLLEWGAVKRHRHHKKTIRLVE